MIHGNVRWVSGLPRCHARRALFHLATNSTWTTYRHTQHASPAIAVTKLTSPCTVREYVDEHPHLLSLLAVPGNGQERCSAGQNEQPSTPSTVYDVVNVQELTEGLINHVYKVTLQQKGDVKGTPTHVLFKYAPPYVKSSAGAVQLSPVRMDVEALAMQLTQACCPAHVPRMVHYDKINNILMVEYVKAIKVLDGIHQHGLIYPHLPRQLAGLLASIYSRTSRYASGTEIHASQVQQFSNSQIVLLNEQVVLTDPLDATNLSNLEPTCPQLKAAIDQFRSDPVITSALSEMVHSYRHDKQVLLHNDLHWGNLLIGEKGERRREGEGEGEAGAEEQLHCIDWEFASYGPMAFDLGSLLAVQLLAIITLSAAMAPGQGGDGHVQEKQLDWLLSSIVEVWEEFVHAYEDQLHLIAKQSITHHEPFNADNSSANAFLGLDRDGVRYHDVVGFASFCMFRLNAGIHSYAGQAWCKDEATRNRCRFQAVVMARSLLHLRHAGGVQGPQDVVHVACNHLREAQRLYGSDAT